MRINQIIDERQKKKQSTERRCLKIDHLLKLPSERMAIFLSNGWK